VRPVQLQRLAPRGHKLNGPRRQKAPSRPIHLMLVGAGRAASAFRIVQLQRLEARGHKSSKPKRQSTPYACRLWASRFRFSICPAPGLRGTCHKSTHPRRQRAPSWTIRLMTCASDQSPSAFLISSSRATRRLTTRPRKAEFCTGINSGDNGIK
jgi:hypothetical protein